MARTVDRSAKRHRILEKAAACFAQSGYDATSMEEVARAAGVSKGSLYDYFESKEDLFYGVFEWFEDLLMRDGMERMASESSAYKRLAAFAEASVAGAVEHVTLYPVMLEVWAAAAKTGTRERFARSMRDMYAAYRAQVTALIAEAQRSHEIKTDIDAAAVAAVLVGAIDGLLLQYWLDPSFDPHRWVRSFFAALFEGIATRPTETSPCA